MSWKTTKLESLCKMHSGGTPSRGKKNYYSGDIPWAKISDIETAEGGVIYNTEEKITEEGLNAINNRIFEKGTLLLAMYGSVGKVAFAGTKMSTNQAILGINIKDTNLLDYSYLKYWFQTIKSQLLDRAVGGTLQNISLGIVKDLEIPLPPLATQKRITEILDAADALRRKDQELLKKYDELAQAIFIDMFGDIMMNNHRFDVVKFGSVCRELFLGLTSKVDYVNEGGFPLVRATDINKGILSFENIKYISEEQHRKVTARRITKRGDVLISKSGSLGTCAIVDTDNEFSTYESIFTVRTNPEKLDNIFLISLIRNPSFQEKLIGGKVGAGVAHLNLNMLRDFEFPLPPMNLQIKYSITSQNIENQINKTKLNKDFSEKLFQNLIQKAFKGELIA